MADHDEQVRQRERARQWIEEKWASPVKNCPVCLSNTWTIGDVAEVREFQGGGLHIGGNVYPVFPVVCNVCGNSLFFNAIVAGVIAPPVPEDEVREEPSSA